MKASLRVMEEKDLTTTLEWRNDELVRRFATAYNAISWAEHEALFKFAKAHRYIFEINDIPCGYLSFTEDPNSTETTWSFHLAPDQRGKGYSDLMLGLGMLEAKRLGFKKILSDVKNDNEASLWLHMKNKFIPLTQNDETNFLHLEKDLK